ncbi:hypothetical protein WJX72_002124 [[Myrmecia] bisecta]|uniref:Fungal lipase-type domain-containing protein n=1 Tax=[Myrmecia] bisecta TaxID=41462 RepID=A0AAW1Q649_9CHLO
MPLTKGLQTAPWTTALCEQAQPVQAQPSESYSWLAKTAGFEQADVDNYLLVANSLKQSVGHLGPWSIGDLAFGLKALATQHLETAVVDEVQGDELTDRGTVEQLRDEIALADAVYERNIPDLCRLSGLKEENVIKFLPDSDHLRPSYTIAVQPQHKQVILAVRGTKSLHDALTNLASSAEPFMGGQAHLGMLRSAEWLKENELDMLAKLLKEHEGYSLRIIGHSLGGGTASLLCMLLRADEDAQRTLGTADITCTSVATPPVVTRELALAAQDYITTVVCQHDVIARACMATFEDIRQEVAKINWADDLKDQVLGKRLQELATNTTNAISSNYGVVAQHVAEVAEKAGVTEATEKVVNGVVEAWEKVTAEAQSAPEAGRKLLGRGKLELEELPPPDQQKVKSEVKGKLQEQAAASEQDVLRLEEGLKDPQGLSDGEVEHLEEAVGFKPPPRMYAPGRLLFIKRTGDGDEAKYTIIQGRPDQRFERIILHSSMLSDHLCSTYIASLNRFLEEAKAK